MCRTYYPGFRPGPEVSGNQAVVFLDSLSNQVLLELALVSVTDL